MNNEEFKVTSEILPFFEKDPQSTPDVDEKNVVSKFTFCLPASREGEEIQAKKDEDGDYVLARKGEEKSDEISIHIGELKTRMKILSKQKECICQKDLDSDSVEKLGEAVQSKKQREVMAELLNHFEIFKNHKSCSSEHSVSTELSLVGLQIWRAALLVADFIIHFRKCFMGKTVLELGSGVGLTSIVAGMFAKKVISTDLDVGNILTLIKSNVERNKRIIKAEICVLGLDFFNREWSSQVKKALEETTIVIAADVIYDNDVTEAFVETVTEIMRLNPEKELYLALEKRYVFTISDLDSVAPCYEHLMSRLRSAQSKPPFSGWTVNEIPLDFPQYFNYERVRQLVMYKIKT